MISTYILIIVIGRFTSLTAVTAEFNSAKTCESARIFMVKNYDIGEDHRIISQGCYKK